MPGVGSDLWRYRVQPCAAKAGSNIPRQVFKVWPRPSKINVSELGEATNPLTPNAWDSSNQELIDITVIKQVGLNALYMRCLQWLQWVVLKCCNLLSIGSIHIMLFLILLYYDVSVITSHVPSNTAHIHVSSPQVLFGIGPCAYVCILFSSFHFGRSPFDVFSFVTEIWCKLLAFGYPENVEGKKGRK